MLCGGLASRAALEMVAVVLHRAFRFRLPGAMDDLLVREPEDLPAWDALADSVEIADWAQGLVRTIRAQPAGDWFLCVAAGLEYLQALPQRHERGDDDEDKPQRTGMQTCWRCPWTRRRRSCSSSLQDPQQTHHAHNK